MHLFRSLAVAAVGLSGAAAVAAPLNLALEGSLVAYNSNGVTMYDAGSQTLSITATPLGFLRPGGAPSQVLPATALGTRTIEVFATVDNAGVLHDGTFRLTGRVDADGNGSLESDGVLLTGDVVEFGWIDSPTPTDQFEIVVRITGGALAGHYSSGSVGMVINSENSDFAGSFASSFSGGAKGNIGGVPAPVCVDKDNAPEIAIDVQKKTQTLRADFNGDKRVDAYDVICYTLANLCRSSKADFDRNGRVDCVDLALFLLAWAEESCGTSSDWDQYKLVFDASDECSDVTICAWIKVGNCYLPVNVESGTVVNVKRHSSNSWYKEKGELFIKTKQEVKLVVKATDASGNETYAYGHIAN